MQKIGRITVEDHVSPLVDAFNATLPPHDHLHLVAGGDAVRVEQGRGPSGPYIRLLPSASLLGSMAYAMQERARIFDEDQAVGRVA